MLWHKKKKKKKKKKMRGELNIIHHWCKIKGKHLILVKKIQVFVKQVQNYSTLLHFWKCPFFVPKYSTSIWFILPQNTMHF